MVPPAQPTGKGCAMSDQQAHRRVIDRCMKRRQSRRPADVVDRIRVIDPAWADAVQARMEAAGYDPRPRHAGEPATPKPQRSVSVPVAEFWTVMAAELATAQGITTEQFMADILQEGLFEAFLEMRAQRAALVRQAREAARPAPPPRDGDSDDDVPF